MLIEEREPIISTGELVGTAWVERELVAGGKDWTDVVDGFGRGGRLKHKTSLLPAGLLGLVGGICLCVVYVRLKFLTGPVSVEEALVVARCASVGSKGDARERVFRGGEGSIRLDGFLDVDVISKEWLGAYFCERREACIIAGTAFDFSAAASETGVGRDRKGGKDVDGMRRKRFGCGLAERANAFDRGSVFFEGGLLRDALLVPVR